MWMQNQEFWDRKVIPLLFGNDGLLVFILYSAAPGDSSYLGSSLLWMDEIKISVVTCQFCFSLHRWLKRKREEKRAEELAAKERARQLRLEARRAKQMQNIHCISSEPKSFRFRDHYSWKFRGNYRVLGGNPLNFYVSLQLLTLWCF